MRRMFQFELKVVGKKEIYNSELKVHYINENREIEAIKPIDNEYYVDNKYYDIYSLFDNRIIDSKKRIKLMIHEDEDSDYEIFIETPINRVSIGYLKSCFGLNKFPYNPQINEIETLKEFAAKLEAKVNEISEEMDSVFYEDFFIGHDPKPETLGDLIDKQIQEKK